MGLHQADGDTQVSSKGQCWGALVDTVDFEVCAYRDQFFKMNSASARSTFCRKVFDKFARETQVRLASGQVALLTPFFANCGSLEIPNPT